MNRVGQLAQQSVMLFNGTSNPIPPNAVKFSIGPTFSFPLQDHANRRR